MKKLITNLLLMVLMIGTLPIANGVKSEAKSTVYFSGKGSVTVEDFDKALQKATGKSETFISDSFGISSGETITNLQAAMLVYNAYRAKEGTTVSKPVKALYDAVVKGVIVKDATKITKSSRKYARYAYVWGIMEGTSAGSYSKRRVFNYSSKLTKEYANTICQRVEDKSLRFKTTKDGQLIRTTGLPKNYKYFPYVLANVPNKFYESRWYYEIFDFGYGKKGPVRMEDYAYPIDMPKLDYYYTLSDKKNIKPLLDQYANGWTELVARNVKTRLSVDYKKIGKEWENALRSTYNLESTASGRAQVDKEYSDYLKFVKKNKITITCSQVYTDTSFLYMTNDFYYYRVHAKFKVTSDNKSFKVPDYGVGLVFALYDKYGLAMHGGFKLNKTYDIIFDIKVGTFGDNHDSVKTVSFDSIGNYTDYFNITK